jgi:hypothetical protein
MQTENIILGQDLMRGQDHGISLEDHVAIFKKGRATRAVYHYPKSIHLGSAFALSSINITPDTNTVLPVWTADNVADEQLLRLAPIGTVKGPLRVGSAAISFGLDKMEAVVFNAFHRTIAISPYRPLCALIKIDRSMSCGLEDKRSCDIDGSENKPNDDRRMLSSPGIEPKTELVTETSLSTTENVSLNQGCDELNVHTLKHDPDEHESDMCGANFHIVNFPESQC